MSEQRMIVQSIGCVLYTQISFHPMIAAAVSHISFVRAKLVPPRAHTHSIIAHIISFSRWFVYVLRAHRRRCCWCIVGAFFITLFWFYSEYVLSSENVLFVRVIIGLILCRSHFDSAFHSDSLALSSFSRISYLWYVKRFNIPQNHHHHHHQQHRQQ